MECESDSPCCSPRHTQDRDAGPLQVAAAGSWSLGIMEQSQSKGCCWLQRDGLRTCEGGDCGRKCLWRKAWQPWKQDSTAESHIGGGTITIASVFPHSSISNWTIDRLAHQTPDPWRTDLQTRTPARGAPLCAWCPEQQRRAPGKGAL